MVDVGILANAITTVAVLVALAIAILQLRDLRRVREGEVILQASQMFATDFMDSYMTLQSLQFKDYQDLKSRYGGRSEESAFMKSVSFFEGIGVLVKRGVIPIALADDFFHGITRVTWLKAEKLIQGHREAMGHPEFVEWFEYLFNKTKDYRR